MGSELKPCPFCPDGGNLTTDGGAISEYGGRSHMDVWVECATCGCEGPKDYDTNPDIIGYADTAIAAWNRRPKQAGVTEAQVERAAHAMHELCEGGIPGSAWNRCSDPEKGMYRKKARAALQAAIDAEGGGNGS